MKKINWINVLDLTLISLLVISLITDIITCNLGIPIAPHQLLLMDMTALILAFETHSLYSL